MVQFLHRFIPNLQLLLKPFHKLTAKNVPFLWNDDLTLKFENIKYQIQSAQILTHPNMDLPFEAAVPSGIL